MKMNSLKRILLFTFGIYISLVLSTTADRLTDNEKTVNSQTFAFLWYSSNECWYGINEEMTKFADDAFKVNVYLGMVQNAEDSLSQKQQDFLNQNKYKKLVVGEPFDFTYWDNLTNVIVNKFPDYDYSECDEGDPDKAAEEWAKRNPWFFVNEEMTNFAYAIHGKLIENNIDPNIDAEIYYAEIDKQMRLRYPDYDWD